MGIYIPKYKKGVVLFKSGEIRARAYWVDFAFIASTKSTFSQCCVVTRRDNTDFTDAIKKGCLAHARTVQRINFRPEQGDSQAGDKVGDRKIRV